MNNIIQQISHDFVLKMYKKINENIGDIDILASDVLKTVLDCSRMAVIYSP